MVQKKWEVLPQPPTEFLEQFPELPTTVAHLLYHRNIRTQEAIDEFLNPDYSSDIHDPYLFNDMKKTVGRIFQAIKNNERIIVHGDYDADGVAASTILVSTIQALGGTNVDVFLPHRETDGYGLNTNTIDILKDEDTKLIITCDCGISNVTEVKYANKKNIDVIITDHHAIPETLPPAFSIIHPKVPGETYPYKDLAGGGVAFKLMQGLLKKHAETHDILANGKKHEMHEKWLLDMVAIASVADMVPLIGESRTLTKYGLIVLNKAQRIGMKKLLQEAGFIEDGGEKTKEITTSTIGFQIGPRINAAGRINHANVAYKLMMETDEIEAAKLAKELNQNNIDRQAMTKDLTKQSIEQIKENADSPVVFILGEEWSTGLVGLIASRLKEKYYKPSIVMALNNGEITGSGRSITGFNIIECFQEMPEYFTKFGGHPMACGFTLADPGKLEDFKSILNQKFIEKTKDVDISPCINIDAELSLSNIDWDLYDTLEKFRPFGMANETPKYLLQNVEVVDIVSMGKENNHIRVMIKEGDSTKKAIGWQFCNGNDPNWCETLNIGDNIDIVCEIDVNEWNGNRELQLMIVDLKKTV